MYMHVQKRCLVYTCTQIHRFTRAALSICVGTIHNIIYACFEIHLYNISTLHEHMYLLIDVSVYRHVPSLDAACTAFCISFILPLNAGSFAAASATFCSRRGDRQSDAAREETEESEPGLLWPSITAFKEGRIPTALEDKQIST